MACEGTRIRRAIDPLGHKSSVNLAIVKVPLYFFRSNTFII